MSELDQRSGPGVQSEIVCDDDEKVGSFRHINREWRSQSRLEVPFLVLLKVKTPDLQGAMARRSKIYGQRIPPCYARMV
jgi:hypothetical protein